MWSSSYTFARAGRTRRTAWWSANLGSQSWVSTRRSPGCLPEDRPRASSYNYSFAVMRTRVGLQPAFTRGSANCVSARCPAIAARREYNFKADFGEHRAGSPQACRPQSAVDVVAIQHHDLVPDLHEVPDKSAVSVTPRIDFGHRAKLTVRTEDEVAARCLETRPVNYKKQL